jgi:AcrR family transcriptional regulator
VVIVTAPLPTNRQKERSELSTNRMLAAAGELIVAGGYEAMTLAAVGERAGYSRGLATARFGSKDELLGALVERIVGRWSHRNVLPRTKGASGRDAIRIVLDAIATQAGRDPSALRVLYALMFEAVGPVAELRSTFVELHADMRADFARFVRRGLRDGSVRPGVSPDNEAAVIVAGIRGIGYQWLLDPDGFDPVVILRHLGRVTDERLRPD